MVASLSPRKFGLTPQVLLDAELLEAEISQIRTHLQNQKQQVETLAAT